MDDLNDFARDLNTIQIRLSEENSKRKQDDQDIIDLLNDVCYKMSLKFKWK